MQIALRALSLVSIPWRDLDSTRFRPIAQIPGISEPGRDHVVAADEGHTFLKKTNRDHMFAASELIQSCRLSAN
jgi:hypothetical protein